MQKPQKKPDTPTRPKTRPHRWTHEDIAVLMARYPDEPTHIVAEALGLRPSSVSQKARSLKIKKSEEFIKRENEIKRLRCLHNLRTNEKVGFKPGHIPWCTGTRGLTAAPSKKPIGSEVISKAWGYVSRKVSDTGDHKRDWQLVHHLNWQAAGREIPPGHMLVFKDGNRLNTHIENLELVTQAELMRRNLRKKNPRQA